MLYYTTTIQAFHKCHGKTCDGQQFLFRQAQVRQDLLFYIFCYKTCGISDFPCIHASDAQGKQN